MDAEAAVGAAEDRNAMKDHVILCGFGQVGYRSFELLRRLGQQVAIIYDHAPSEWLAEAASCGAVCLQGDARDDALLEKAGAREALALIAATDQDMVNISIALDARMFNPKMRIVVRLFDQVLAPHLKKSLCLEQVLSTSALAAPVFVAAALEEECLSCFCWEGKSYKVVEVAQESHKIKQAPAQLVLCQSESSRSSLSNRAADEVRSALLRLPHTLASFFLGIPLPIKCLLLTLLVIGGSSVVVFHQKMKLTFIDALYFVSATVTTTGFGDINFSAADNWLKIYGCLLMFCGALLMALLVSFMADYMFALRVKEWFFKHEMPKEPHHILIGLGHIGYRIARTLLDSGEEVVVICGEAKDGFAAALRKDCLIIEGDARNEDILIRAGVRQAKALIAVKEDDVINLGSGFLARTLNPGIRTVIKVFDDVLGKKLRAHLALDSVLSVSGVSAPTIVSSALYPDVVEAFIWKDSLITVIGQKENEQPINYGPERGENNIAVPLTTSKHDAALGMNSKLFSVSFNAKSLPFSVMSVPLGK